MPGFFISNMKNNPTFEKEYDNADYIYRCTSIDGWNVQNLTLNKYLNDKIFLDIDKAFVIIEGVIFNSKHLCKETASNNLSEYVEFAINNKIDFWKEFKGTYSGAVFYKKKNCWTCFVNPIGDKPIFYWSCESNVIISSSLEMIIKTLQANNHSYSLNKQGIYNILTYGHMEDIETQVNGICRLAPGHYLECKNPNLIELHEYHSFNNSSVCEMSEQEILETLDK